MKINKRTFTEGAKASKKIETQEIEKKLTEAEEPSDDNLVIDDVNATPVSDIADAVITATEVATDGEETYSAEKAEKIATEIKTHAKGLDYTKWAPLDVPSALTIALDKCLSKSLIAQKSGRKDGCDLLINGLPGSAKTGIVNAWAEARGVNLFSLNSNDEDIGAVLNGFPIDNVEQDEEGKNVHYTARSYSRSLDSLKEPMSVLFLDEFNRAPQKLRASLLKLINEHEVTGPGKNGKYRFDNLLFTIACINPAVPTDPGAIELNDAEKSRFAKKIKWDSTPEEALRYLTFYLNKTINNLDPKDPDYAFLYREHKAIYYLMVALLTDSRFNFDTRDDLAELADEQKSPLNQRSLTDGLMIAGSDKEDFLDWVDNNSDFLQRDIDMIHEILDPWTMPEIKVPGIDDDAETGTGTGTEQDDSTSAPVKPVDETDFDSVFGSDGTEVDTGLFGSSGSSAGNAAKVSAADALSRIKGFDFTL